MAQRTWTLDEWDDANTALGAITKALKPYKFQFVGCGTMVSTGLRDYTWSREMRKKTVMLSATIKQATIHVLDNQERATKRVWTGKPDQLVQATADLVKQLEAR